MVSPEDLCDRLAERSPDAARYDGLDEALVGTACRPGMAEVLVYDHERCVEILMRSGLSRLEAIDWLGANAESQDLGEGTPLFLYR